MSSNSSEDENKIKPEKLNAGDAKIIFWIIIITIIITIILIIYFAIQSTGEGGGDKLHTFPESKNVRTEKETYFCPYYAPLLGFWASYGFSCATVPEGYCFNYDKADQIDEPEEDADDRENQHICPTWIRVSYPLNEEDKLFVASWWEELIFGHPIMQDMFNQSNGEMYGWICEDDVEFTEECAVDSEGIDLSELVNDCQCSNGCGWTDVKVAQELISQNDGHHTYENTLWKHQDDPYVQGSGCSLVAVVNAARGLGMSLTVEEVADYSYNVAQIQNGGWKAVETLAQHYGLEITYMYDNVNQEHISKQAKTDEEKINYVKQALASKKMVIASGTNPPIIGAGGCTPGYDCTFTNGGHFVAIVAATSDGKFIVANPGNESRSATNWTLPQDGVAKYMDIVAAVGLEGSGELRNCSGQGEQPGPGEGEHDIVRIQAIEDKVNVRKEMKVSQTEICGRKVHLKEIIKVENKLEPDTSGECQKGWYKVEDNKDAYWPGCYVCADFFGEYTEEDCTESVKKYTNKTEVRVREQPATSGKRIAELDCGTEIEVCKTPLHDSSSSACTDGWVKITGGKYNGYYMCSNYLNSTKPGNEVCNPPSGEDPPGEDPSGEDPPSPGPTSTEGKLGLQSSSGYWSSCQNTLKNIPWRKDGSTMCDSGCSLIAVANSAKRLGKVSGNDPQSLAYWTKTHISSTGWDQSLKPILSHAGLKQSGGWLWDSYQTSTDTKIKKIRETLSKGWVVIAGGDRQKNNPYSEYKGLTCNGNASAQKKGYCAFSNNGHFITILGITADNKLIIAGPAGGTNGTYATDKLPADGVLRASNKAIAVKAS